MHRDLGKGPISCGDSKHSFLWFVLEYLAPKRFIYRRMGKKAQANREVKLD
jgi:hypothetical protein